MSHMSNNRPFVPLRDPWTNEWTLWFRDSSLIWSPGDPGLSDGTWRTHCTHIIHKTLTWPWNPGWNVPVKAAVKSSSSRWMRVPCRCGEIFPQDLNVTGRDMRGIFITNGLVIGGRGWELDGLRVLIYPPTLTCIKNCKGRSPCCNFKDIQMTRSARHDKWH